MRDYKNEYNKRKNNSKEIRGLIDNKTYTDFKNMLEKLECSQANFIRKAVNDFIYYGSYTSQFLIDIDNKILELQNKIHEEERTFL